ncbi:PBP1A family penicillin-binding protein [Candidatus Gottesmanbacteria bacterium]|nr:PBP1A family penicillin-binding protein [Candidatus Gottesmanbacteria bacterium]
MYDTYWQRQVKRRFTNPRSRLSLMTTLAVSFFFLLLAGFLFIGLLFAWYAKDLPRPDKVKRSEGLSTVIVDRNGENLYDIFENENRIPVVWEDISKTLKDATIAVEDKDFYKHQGLSTTGIFRALVSIVLFHNIQGGSTLTQQLVKNALLSSERTIPRKMKEAILAIQIERKYTKDEILQMYLNEAPYGGTAVGIESASQYYYNKKTKDLTSAEAVILAGFPQSPSIYSPFTGEAKAYIARSQQVLRRMREDGYISPIQETQIRKDIESVKFASGSESLRAPHFVAYIKEQLITKFGSKLVEAGGLKVTTTLDWKLQEIAQKIVNEEVTKAKSLKVSNGAAVVIRPQTGEILAMIGSKDYAATDSGGLKFNVATQGLRQPGSAIKPITYATAFKKGYTASTLLLDVDTKYPSGDIAKPEYNPKNYDSKFRGPIQLRYAFGNSINTIAVKVSALVGVKDILKTASDMGITSLEPTDENIRRIGLSLTLGGGEVKLIDLTSSFGVFATGGFRSEPISILKVEDAKGKILYEWKPTSPRRVLPADVSYLISHILSDNDARREIFGPRSYLAISGRNVAVKTGTTDDKRDNWTIGYTTGVVAGAWVGNNDNSPMHTSLASGVTGAAPIWNRIIREAIKDTKDEPFERPGTIIEMEIDAFGGGLPVDGYPTRKELFIKGTEPTGPASIFQKVKVSKKDSGKLANPVEIAKLEYDEKSFVVIHEDDPVSTDGKNRWQEGIDGWVASQSDAKFHPPNETYSGTDEPIALTILEPGDFSQVNDSEVKVRSEAGSINTVTKMEIFIDGNLTKTVNDVSKISEKIPIANGSHIIKVKAYDNKNNSNEREAHVGINEPYTTPTPTPTPTP